MLTNLDSFKLQRKSFFKFIVLLPDLWLTRKPRSVSSVARSTFRCRPLQCTFVLTAKVVVAKFVESHSRGRGCSRVTSGRTLVGWSHFFHEFLPNSFLNINTYFSAIKFSIWIVGTVFFDILQNLNVKLKILKWVKIRFGKIFSWQFSVLIEEAENYTSCWKFVKEMRP